MTQFPGILTILFGLMVVSAAATEPVEGSVDYKTVGDQFANYSPAHNISADDPMAIVFFWGPAIS